MSKNKNYFQIDGTDNAGNKSYLLVNKNKETGKIHIYSPEECSDVILKTKQARELIEAIKKCIIE